jgi:hypothetical protein
VSNSRIIESLLLALGLVAAAGLLGHSVQQLMAQDRSVSVKGLAEREVPADTAIWPIAYGVADSDLPRLYQTLDSKNAEVVAFLKAAGFTDSEIAVSAPSITDRQAQDYGNAELATRLRYTGKSTITVYTRKVDRVRASLSRLGALGKQGIALSTENYENRTQFIFTGLNALKPAMIEEATRNARLAAEKFAKDSQSTLGKIRRANQGQFSIEDRDASTPYIKKLRVVSSVEYSLTD